MDYTTTIDNPPYGYFDLCPIVMLKKMLEDGFHLGFQLGKGDHLMFDVIGNFQHWRHCGSVCNLELYALLYYINII